MGQVTPLCSRRMMNFKKKTIGLSQSYLHSTIYIYERLLVAQLGSFCQAILSDFISSYRKFHSCETALLKLTEEWRPMFDKGELVVVVSMDLSKPFNIIDHDLLLAKLN